ncbi:hypothetical protein NDU88_004968 [Pleurodeles waltl]|uniref:Uncharacterized protein n=1 Tax=Pleurodeles waltl TaxID=8319 RepID=A0AAV7KZU8_PLEWA|nr:hypothetical protein NDU88_004968 [Pleurodeles waltl]
MKLRKHYAGQLEGFDRLTKAFHKSARALKRPPFREGLLPRETGEEAHHIWDPDVGSPKRIEGDTEGDSSSGEEQESDLPWHPVPTMPDQQEAGIPVQICFIPRVSTIRDPRNSDKNRGLLSMLPARYDNLLIRRFGPA